ncbi:MAG: DUF4112 domain-containing protein [Gemmatimonadota bacterium]|nr:DUF4112 domain-containing protein [Gemmatimonadota bacterium]
MGERTGELSTLDARANQSLARARSLATLLDSSIPIPGTKKRIGLDPILGLVPFVGDFAGALLSSYIVLAAAQAGVPAFTLIRMILNIGLDTLAGSVPIVGDIFDAAFKSNAMNIALFESHVSSGVGPSRSVKDVSRLAGVVMLASALACIALLTFVLFLVYLVVSRAVTGP